jgi:hypothetical protein
MNPVHSLPLSFISILILFSHLCLGCPSCPHPLTFPHKNPVCIFCLPHMCHMSHPFHSLQLHIHNTSIALSISYDYVWQHGKTVWRTVYYVMKLSVVVKVLLLHFPLGVMLVLTSKCMGFRAGYIGSTIMRYGRDLSEAKELPVYQTVWCRIP